MLGYAVTCAADTTTETRAGDRGLMRMWEAVEAAPKPALIVIKEMERPARLAVAEPAEKSSPTSTASRRTASVAANSPAT